MLKTLSLLIVVLFLAGCSKPAEESKLSPAEHTAAKVEAMKKLVEAADAPNPEFAVRAALEKFRDIPFDAKSTPAEAKQILEMYAKVKSKIKGDVADELKGDMNSLENQLK